MEGPQVAHWIIGKAKEAGWEQAGTKEVSTAGQCPPQGQWAGTSQPWQTLPDSPVLVASL